MKETQPTTISKKVGNAFAGFAVLNHAAEMMMKELQRNMHAEKIDLKQSRKLLFKQLQTAVERTKYLYEQFTEDSICTANGECEEAFDALLRDANAITTLMMLYYNATYGNIDNLAKIIQYMKSLKVSEQFTDEQIKQFESRL